MGGGINGILKKYGARIEYSEVCFTLSFLLTALAGGCLIYQGRSGVKLAPAHTSQGARRHFRRGRICGVVLIVLTLIKFGLDAMVLNGVASSIEEVIKVLPQLAESYNTDIKTTSDSEAYGLALDYGNGTTLFLPNGSHCLGESQSHPNAFSSGRLLLESWDELRIFRVCEEDHIVLLSVRHLRRQIKSFLYLLLISALIFTLVSTIIACVSLSLCNWHYLSACESTNTVIIS